tara:strand:- start:128 stop:1321 length:1194 start_codon:yes stop_codon:yes gene_type:complete
VTFANSDQSLAGENSQSSTKMMERSATILRASSVDHGISFVMPQKATRDSDARRATMGVAYPGSPLVLESRDDIERKLPEIKNGQQKHVLENKVVSFRLKGKTIENCVFTECSFHDQDGKKHANITSLTFRGCLIEKCMLGTTIYDNVRFRNCDFKRTDFQNADFFECFFDDQCNFEDCTATDTKFERTEIPPNAFLGAVTFPRYNHANSTKEVSDHAIEEFLENKLHVSEQVHASVVSAEYSDESLFHVKQAAVAYCKNRLCRESPSQIRRAFRLKFWRQVALPQCNIWLTRGGTSFTRLVVVLLLLMFVVSPALFHIAGIKHQSMAMQVNFDGVIVFVKSYVFIALQSTTLWLGFGFTSYCSSSPTGQLILAFCGTLAFGWIALLIPVLVRRVYQ